MEVTGIVLALLSTGAAMHYGKQMPNGAEVLLKTSSYVSQSASSAMKRLRDCCKSKKQIEMEKWEEENKKTLTKLYFKSHDQARKMLWAIGLDDIQKVQKLLRDGVDPTVVQTDDNQDLHPFFMACMEGKINIAKACIDFGADPSMLISSSHAPVTEHLKFNAFLSSRRINNSWISKFKRFFACKKEQDINSKFLKMVTTVPHEIENKIKDFLNLTQLPEEVIMIILRYRMHDNSPEMFTLINRIEEGNIEFSEHSLPMRSLPIRSIRLIAEYAIESKKRNQQEINHNA